jgi:hypothetical protein
VHKTDSKIVAIDALTGRGRLLLTELPPADAVSMDFDDQGNLWLLANGKDLSVVDLESGALAGKGVLPGMHVNQRHGTIRDNVLHSAFFEADPSNIWKVGLDDSSVQAVVSTDLPSTYTLAFVDATAV